MQYVDAVAQTVTTGGTSTRILNASAVSDDFTTLGASDDGKRFAGRFLQSLSVWEIGIYEYTHASRTLTTVRVTRSSAGAGAAVNIPIGAVFQHGITADAVEDLGRRPSDLYNMRTDVLSTEAQCTGSADTTAEWRDLMAEIESVAIATGGGTFSIDMTNANTRIDGALLTTGGRNAQIIGPTIPNASQPTPCPHVDLKIFSRHPKIADLNKTGSGTTPFSPGGRITSTITGSGTLPSVFEFSGPTSWPAGSTGRFDRVSVFLENIELFTAGPTANMTAWNLRWALQVMKRNVLAAAGGLGRSDYSAVPSSTNISYGFYNPGNSNNVTIVDEGCVAAVGFSYGHSLSEHHVGDLQSLACRWGLDAAEASHMGRLNRLGMWYCPQGIRCTATLGTWIAIGVIAIEYTESGIWARVRDIDDPSNFMRGSAQFHGVRNDGVTTATVIKNGGTNFSVTGF